jgi:hypothetical protein
MSILKIKKKIEKKDPLSRPQLSYLRRISN